MHSYIRPNTYIVLRLPSGIFRVLEIIPNTTINIGKYGSFPANLLLGRPYYLTFELLDKEEGKSQTELRIVPPTELHAEAVTSDNDTPTESRTEPVDGVEYDIVGENGEVIMKNNRLTVDDPSRQALSFQEIEELKKAGSGSGKDIIAKIMASHQAIDEKTTFSLAKYTLRKSKKYLRRFTVLPLDVGVLAEFVTEKEAHKIMELREESIGLIGSWANVHCAASSRIVPSEDGKGFLGGGRWLVVDDTGGLVVAALAERMGILYSEVEDDEGSEEVEARDQDGDVSITETLESERAPPTTDTSLKDPDIPCLGSKEEAANNGDIDTSSKTDVSNSTPKPRKSPRQHIPAMSATTNTLTIVHANNQPNLGLLKYFNFDSSNPEPSHPLYHNLKTISWLQLLHPEEDPAYVEPELVTEDVLSKWKSSKRGAYYKKRRRWERSKRVINETKAGGFDGLIVASVMEPATILRELVPLVRGAGTVVVYSPTVEPLVELCDFYSKERRTAYVARAQRRLSANGKVKKEGIKQEETDESPQWEEESDESDSNFPVNPTLLLAPMLQTSRARHWQVLPGRTHPLMTSRGGSEGYLFTATRVLPAQGKVEARGRFKGVKKRKAADGTAIEA